MADLFLVVGVGVVALGIMAILIVICGSKVSRNERDIDPWDEWGRGDE